MSSAFYPEISPRSFRATELAKEFYRQGHEVSVVSKYRDFDYSGFLHEFPISFRMWKKPAFPSIPIWKLPLLSFLSRAIFRILAVLFEYPAIEEMYLVREALKSERGYDLMISFAVPFPVHWGVTKARSRDHLIANTWVADCGDPYMFARLDSVRKPFYFKYLEKRFCRDCSYITVPFDDMQTQFYKEFRSKMRTIPQGFNFREIRLYDGKPSYEISSFIFAGSVIPGKRDLALFLEFLSRYPGDFIFIVYTSQKEWFLRYKEVLGEKLQLKSYIDRLSLIFEMSKVSFLVNVDTIHDTQTNIEAVPSKLIDYALSGRPVLNISSHRLDEDLVQEFLEGNYKRQRLIDKDSYDIRKVTSSFMNLVE
ncbi:MAG: hypothetical protein P1P86_12710 [Bacteroidales bacterium]|nr:hypothetical protein [Bacteroidales bacterium]